MSKKKENLSNSKSHNQKVNFHFVKVFFLFEIEKWDWNAFDFEYVCNCINTKRK